MSILQKFNEKVFLLGIGIFLLFSAPIKIEADQGARVWHAYYVMKRCPESSRRYLRPCREYYYSKNWDAGRHYITRHDRTYNEAQRAHMIARQRDSQTCTNYCWRASGENFGPINLPDAVPTLPPQQTTNGGYNENVIIKGDPTANQKPTCPPGTKESSYDSSKCYVVSTLSPYGMTKCSGKYIGFKLTNGGRCAEYVLKK